MRLLNIVVGFVVSLMVVAAASDKHIHVHVSDNTHVHLHVDGAAEGVCDNGDCSSPVDAEGHVLHAEASERLLGAGAFSACSSFSGRTLDGLKSAVKRWVTDKPDPVGGQGHKNDGIPYKNLSDPKLPDLSSGNFYTEWGFYYNRGPDDNDLQRVVISNKGKMYVSFDHYKSFCISPNDATDKNYWQF